MSTKKSGIDNIFSNLYFLKSVLSYHSVALSLQPNPEFLVPDSIKVIFHIVRSREKRDFLFAFQKPEHKCELFYHYSFEPEVQVSRNMPWRYEKVKKVIPVF